MQILLFSKPKYLKKKTLRQINSQEILAAKEREIKGSIGRGTHKIVSKKKVPIDASVRPSCLVFAVKENNVELTHKARMSFGGHRVPMKCFVVYSSQNSQSSTIRLALLVAVNQRFDVWFGNVCQAFQQSD